MNLRHLLAASFVTVVLIAACSEEKKDETPSCTTTTTCPYPLNGMDLMSPAISFNDDIIPIFRRSCAFEDCHIEEDKLVRSDAGADAGFDTIKLGVASELFLGINIYDTTQVVDDAMKQRILDNLIDKPSKTAPAMVRVKANEPDNSFLMLKLDGCQGTLNLMCDPQSLEVTGCGNNMPDNGDNELLCDDERNVIRRWIAQGAQNN